MSEPSNSLRQLNLLASALAGRGLRVATTAKGEATWTDGKVVYVDGREDPAGRVRALAVQASLLAAGSLDPPILRKLFRRPKLAQRYLALEGHRALSWLTPRLPPALDSLLDRGLATRSDSPEGSLSLARAGAVHTKAPRSFGTIRPGRMLAALEPAATKRAQSLDPLGLRRKPLERFDDGEGHDTEHGGLGSHVGSGGALGRLLAKLLVAGRRGSGGGTPGANAPTHQTLRGLRRGTLIKSAPRLPPVDANPGASQDARATTYPEWDEVQQRYRADWCAVLDQEVPVEADLALPPRFDRSALRRALARTGLGMDHRRRQPQGDDIDIDAAIESQVERIVGSCKDPAAFIDSVRRRRDLSALLLLDVSGSGAELSSSGRTVHQQQQAAAEALTLCLHELGDRVALWAYRSQGRSAVHFLRVKGFGEERRTQMRQRLHSLKPGGYSRLGAAIRHGTAVLGAQGGTQRRLLVVVSDGLAYDHGYELAYGAADARRALEEARADGVGCVCLSVGAATRGQSLQRVFGTSAYAAIDGPAELSRVVARLFYRAAAATNTARRQVAQGGALC